eukprot:TRINITY_DN6030_c0_g2_i1.p1 TRINITY_DN6030_c0_g2~~TRINITY_DN6030_c0_g2_i1.p1  ORF type:complete len:511 (-),score=65.98 TRINITY_DN6030_c0_g2_i1:550-2082(-)
MMALPENVVVFVKFCQDCAPLKKEEIVCFYGEKSQTPAISVELKEPGHMMIKCPHFPPSTEKLPLKLKLKGGDIWVPSETLYPANFRGNLLAYEALLEPDSVILMVKGLNLRSGKISSTDNLVCVFASSINSSLHYSNRFRKLEKLNFGKNVIKTRVLMAAQEVLRCEKPNGITTQELDGMKVSVWEYRRGLLPSVARLNVNFSESLRESSERMHSVCACTMIWNQASFLEEWIMYHSYLGISKWFLYDNNSDDNIEETIESLSAFNVSRHVWPWIKSQEAGFSHCALRARRECKWVAFMDVDEFLNPIHYILDNDMPESTVPTEQSVMQRLIENVTSAEESDPEALKVGEIRIDCHSFGPSGLRKHPTEGQIAGYTCRMNRTERHKSIVRVSALNESLINVVHHFHLDSGYRYISIPRGFAVINHYKYQVWENFKAKFFRRVATYVSDWKESQNQGSNDRAPGLGTEPIEPEDWHTRFCEVRDTVLRNFTLETLTDPSTQLLPWQQHFR